MVSKMTNIMTFHFYEHSTCGQENEVITVEHLSINSDSVGMSVKHCCMHMCCTRNVPYCLS